MTDTHGTGHDMTHDSGHDSGHGSGHGAGHDHGHGDGHDDGHGGGHDHGHGAAHPPPRAKEPGTRHSAQHTAHARQPARPGGASLAGWARGVAVVSILTVVLLPFFLVIYRLTLFGAVPHDGNAPFLLGLLGLPGGAIPPSPAGYRALSVLAAAPLYFLLPPLPVAGAPAGLSADFVQATAALALLSQICVVGTLYATYRLARDRAGQDAGSALLAAALIFVLSWYSQFFGLDPLAILLITLGLYLVRNVYGFALLLLSAPIINETIAIVFALWLTFRCATSATDRAAMGLQWTTAMAALLLYAGLLAFGHLPGNGPYLAPDQYMDTLRGNLADQATLPGLLLNVLPTTLLLTLGLIGHFGWRRRPMHMLPWGGLFRPVDLLVIPAMVGVAAGLELGLGEPFQPGRMVMHAAPLFVVPAAAAVFHRLAGRPAAEPHAS